MDKYQLLVLLSIPKIGSARIRQLLSHFGSPEEILSAKRNALFEVKGLDKSLIKDILEKRDVNFAEQQLKKCKEYGVQIISFWDREYPDLLKKIYDPPVLIFMRGCLSKEPNIAVVGMRRASSYGKWAAERLAQEMAGMGITIVSGMARGIDTSAHKGALNANGKTIAVLGCGVDMIYPPENRDLYQRIICSGAVLSEFPMGTEPAAGLFPRRNRIISGLSLGTVVVEAGQKSGALITAYMALEQGREVFAVPGSIKAGKSEGPHRLIKEGAKLVENAEDIIQEIQELKKLTGRMNKMEITAADLSREESAVWDILTDEPLHIDQIAIKTETSPSEALAVLLSLELKNYIRQLSGMCFIRR